MSFATPLTGLIQQVWPLASASATNDSTLLPPIREQARKLRAGSDAQLAAQLAELRNTGQTPSTSGKQATIIAACAIACEGVRRVLGIEFYDSQLLGGLALASGAIAEMQTGEGKTFTTVLPATLFALPGDGVHVMTVNAYLAKRDFQLLEPVYRLLGYTVGLIDSEATPEVKRAAYACDITYGAGNEFGFDYLRDQAALLTRQKPILGSEFRRRLRGKSTDRPISIQRGHAAAIVDEADSVMIDEATTPLVLAMGGGTVAENAEAYRVANRIAKRLRADHDFVIDDAKMTIELNAGVAKQLQTPPDVAQTLQLDRPWLRYVEQALRANHMYSANVHYVVHDGDIQIVDQNTGRIFKDRTWRDGLHQAVQAAEGLQISAENRSLVRISRQRFFQLYDLLGGLTGTAMSAKDEFRKTYGLEVRVIDPNKPCLRSTRPTRAFLDATCKEAAIAAEVVRIHRSGQPILVGTSSIAVSERISQLLVEQGVSHECLNGKQDADEAELIARAGQMNAITIATNMAGRGADISLGRGVAELGGLHVIASEPQQTYRVDRQLFGRSARQGNPGSCQMFTSADDALFVESGSPFNARERQSATPEGEVFPLRSIESEIAQLQKRAEQAGAARRARLYAHDDWLEGVLRDLT